MRLKNEGFTLLEIMIVIAIIGILAMVLAPNLSSSRAQFALRTNARSCVADLRYTQQLSMDTKVEYGMYFTTNGYQIKAGSTVVKTVEFDGVTFQGITPSSTSIIFKTDGTPYSSGDIDFKSTSTNAHTYVRVTPGTGDVSIP